MEGEELTGSRYVDRYQDWDVPADWEYSRLDAAGARSGRKRLSDVACAIAAKLYIEALARKPNDP